MKLIIVESPAKAKTITKYLGTDFRILASYGHVRAIPSKKDSVLPAEDFLIKYEILDKHKKHLDKIIEAAESAESVLLATDPDREGEAISWHIYEILRTSLKKKVNCKRIVFYEITKPAIFTALQNPQDINIKLVNAQQARQALDYLVGFSLSPVLWRKLPGCRSAGRVQSVALRIICSREEERESFVSEEYWTVELDFLTYLTQKNFTGKLICADGKKLSKFSIKSQSEAEKIKSLLEKQKFYISKIDKKRQKRNPPPPLITSSLQQEAFKKLNFTSKKTMSIAQKLYEGVEVGGQITGLITYMRTDCYNLSEIALAGIRKYIQENMGNEYLPDKPNKFKAKKNTQEAHEAIRPTDVNLTPSKLSQYLTKEQSSLYNLIWSRAVISQMSSAIMDITSIEVNTQNEQFKANASGTSIYFAGFYKLYDKDQQLNILPHLKEKEDLNLISVKNYQHFTEPKPRFNEASLIKELEELGIGRPSTYSTIISVLLDRKYLVLDAKKFIPSAIGRILNVFLMVFFKKYVEYDFTAYLEKKLDDISFGNIYFKELLKEFWQDFDKQIIYASSNSIQEVISFLEAHLKIYIHKYFGSEDFSSDIICPKCKEGVIKSKEEVGVLNLKLSKYGPFLACNKYPDCSFTKQILGHNSSTNDLEVSNTDLYLGSQTEHDKIFLKKGPYGFYLEKIDNASTSNSSTKSRSKKEKSSKYSTKRISIPKLLGDPTKISLDAAIKLLQYPLLISNIKGKDAYLKLGKFGPYISYNNMFFSIPKTVNFLEISKAKVEQIIANQSIKKRVKK